MNKKIIDAAAITLLGLILLIFGIYLNVKDSNYRRDWKTFRLSAETAEGVISRIEVKFSLQKHKGHKNVLFAEYTDNNGVTHEAKLEYSDPDMRVGDTVIVYYDKDHPEKTMSDPAVALSGNDTARLMLITTGGIATMIGAAALFIGIKGRI
ncbi:MAG: DUF3592 domain-containing protein [Ruminococcus sp.]|nr:DUF3592 domain-containing protein [Ruminococcus sp.]